MAIVVKVYGQSSSIVRLTKAAAAAAITDDRWSAIFPSHQAAISALRSAIKSLACISKVTWNEKLHL